MDAPTYPRTHPPWRKPARIMRARKPLDLRDRRAIAAMLAGTSRAEAARIAQISPATLYRWLRPGGRYAAEIARRQAAAEGGPDA